MINMKNTLTPILTVLILTGISFSQDKAVDMSSKGSKRRAAIDAERNRNVLENLPVVEDTKWSIEIASKKDSFSGGEPVEIGITLKNNGASKTRLMLNEVEGFYEFEIIDPDLVPSPRLISRFRGRSGSGVTVNMGQVRSKSGTVVLNNLFDMSLEGTYRIKVSKKFRLQGKADTPLIISSNILNVEVTSTPQISQWR